MLPADYHLKNSSHGLMAAQLGQARGIFPFCHRVLRPCKNASPGVTDPFMAKFEDVLNERGHRV